MQVIKMFWIDNIHTIIEYIYFNVDLRKLNSRSANDVFVSTSEVERKQNLLNLRSANVVSGPGIEKIMEVHAGNLTVKIAGFLKVKW